MSKYYTDEKNVLYLVTLLKKYGIKKAVVSPGTTNMTFVGSLQSDPFFELYSSVDERSAAYIACGLSVASGEPVVLSCTGATASRNYYPGLTEAYYRKLPILAVTSTQFYGRIGQNLPQVIDRRQQPYDVVKMSKQIPLINTKDEEWATIVSLNEAINELWHKGCGPVHINLGTGYSKNYEVKELPEIRMIKRVEYEDNMPEMPHGKIGIFVGNHKEWSCELTDTVDRFCELYNGVVLCDSTSNYKGKYKVFSSLITKQKKYISGCLEMDLLVHIGDVSGSSSWFKPQKVWRVNPDGVIRDTFYKLENVFEMRELDFFRYYVESCERKSTEKKVGYFEQWNSEYKKIFTKIRNIPFSNLWIAKTIFNVLPTDCILYLGILNTLRCWNYFMIPDNVIVYSNTGGFGIDGGMSTLLGLALANPQKKCIGVVGDLGFFYDMNVLGNRHIMNNMRILLINNGLGTEFTNYDHPAALFGEDAKPFMAAEGHFGKKSTTLVKHFSEDLGFEYISASSKEEFKEKMDILLTNEDLSRPLLFEVFTNGKDESDALEIINETEIDFKKASKMKIKKILGDVGTAKIRNLIE